jgi:hypothetical protein
MEPLSRPIYRCMDEAKIDLGDTGLGGLDWVGFDWSGPGQVKWRACVNAVMSLWVP